jgi:hypothetical protein
MAHHVNKPTNIFMIIKVFNGKEKIKAKLMALFSNYFPGNV